MPFVKEVHGEGSWAKAMAVMSEATKMTEEVRELVPELSGFATE